MRIYCFGIKLIFATVFLFLKMVHVGDNRCFFLTVGRMKMAWESYFEKHAQEVWEKPDGSWHAYDVVEHAPTWLNTYNPNDDGNDSEGASWTNLKRMIRWNRLGEIIGSVPETSLDWGPIFKERGWFWEWQRWIFSWRSGVGREPRLVQRLVA